MNRKKLVSSILTIVLCLSLIAGTTYALFTSQDEVDIAVNSGKASVTADIVEESLKATLGNAGTTAAFDNDGNLVLENLTPGDKVEFEINLVNSSNVLVQYRLTWAVEGDLYGYLEATADGTKIVNNVTDWKTWEIPTAEDGKDSKTIKVSVELPAEVGNVAQDKNANISFKIEAVQANGADLYGKTIVSDLAGLTAALADTNDNNTVAVVDPIEINDTVALDLNGKTVEGNFVLVDGANLTVEDGVLINDDPAASAIQVNGGNLTLDNVAITSARHALRIEGDGSVVTINGGTYVAKGSAGKTQHALNVGEDDANCTVVINGGTFIGPKGTAADSGSAVTVKAGSTVTINGGNFSGGKNNTLSSKGTLVVTGGTFDQDPSAYVAEDYKAVANADGSYSVIFPQESFEDLINNAQPGDTVNVPVGNFTLSGTNDLVIVGSGENTMITVDGALKNANISNATIAGNAQISVGKDQQLVLTNVIFEGEAAKFGHVSGTAIFTGCTFNGLLHFDSSSETATVKFVDCTFGETSVIKLGASAHYIMENCTVEKWAADATGPWGKEWLITYGDITMTDCKIGRVIRAGSAINITLNNCVDLADVAVTGAIVHKNANPTVVINGITQIFGDSAEEIAGNMSDYLAGEEKVEIVMKEDLTFSAGDTASNSGYGATGLTVNNGSTLDGNGKTLTVNNANSTWDCAVNPKSGTIKNLTINGAFRGIFMGSAEGDVYIDNVIIDKVCYTFNSDGGSKEYGVYISNSTLNGWTSCSDVHKEVIFTNCQFGKGTGGYQYAFCRPYNYTEFIGCNFEEGFVVDPIGAVVFENCTINGVAITAENVSQLVTSTNNVTVK